MPEPQWISWQSLRSNGPGRWSSNHLTLDGTMMLCGTIKPAQVFRDDGLGQNTCPKCARVLAKLRAKGK
jgi:hypothetical protein